MLFPLILAAVVGLGEFSSGVKADIEKRISRELVRGDRVSEVTGTVTYSDELRFFVQDGRESLKMVLDRGVVPKCGEVVSVTGYPSLEGGRVVMVVKSWKSVGQAALPEPLTPSSSDLTENGGRGVNWMRIRLEGRAFEATENGFAMDVGDKIRRISFKGCENLNKCVLDIAQFNSFSVCSYNNLFHNFYFLSGISNLFDWLSQRYISSLYLA